jgi:hypothetical protein
MMVSSLRVRGSSTLRFPRCQASGEPSGKELIAYEVAKLVAKRNRITSRMARITAGARSQKEYGSLIFYRVDQDWRKRRHKEGPKATALMILDVLLNGTASLRSTSRCIGTVTLCFMHALLAARS